jgi:beta-lactamase superfamily II metal-dependent hydrolase
MPMHLDILDVGQGDGMMLWLPNGKVMMIDYGSTRNKDLVQKDSFKYFSNHTKFSKPGQVLDWLVLTHGDRDHYNMVEAFLTQFSVNVRNVLHGGLESEYKGLIGKLRDRTNPDGTKTVIQTGANKGFYPLATDLGAEVMVIAIGVVAAGTGEAHIKNTRSVVLRVVYKGIGLLLAGDATSETEGQIVGLMNSGAVKKDALQANLLKVPHHGSHRSSNHAIFLVYVNPNFAFISSDRNGALDGDQIATGHRLPQALTISLILKYATRLQKNCGEHSYVMAYQKSDYVAYNANPDIKGQTVDPLVSDNDNAWIQRTGTEGIFSTLTTMGLSEDPNNEGAKDLGVQYRVTISDDGDFEILSTEEFEVFDKLGEVTA